MSLFYFPLSYFSCFKKPSKHLEDGKKEDDDTELTSGANQQSSTVYCSSCHQQINLRNSSRIYDLLKQEDLLLKGVSNQYKLDTTNKSNYSFI